MQIIEDGYGGNHDPSPNARDLLIQAYEQLRDLNGNTNDMNAYFHGVQDVTQLVAEAIDLLGGQDGNTL